MIFCDHYQVWLVIAVLLACFFLLFRVKKHHVQILLSMLCICFVFVALTEPVFKYNSDSNKAVILLDVSDSIGERNLLLYRDKIRSCLSGNTKYDDYSVLVFASEPLLIESGVDSFNSIVDMRKDITGIFAGLNKEYFADTDIYAAMLYAVKLLNGRGDVYLFSDAIETKNCLKVDDFISMYPGISFHADISQDYSAPRISLEKVQVPENVAVGQKANSYIEIRATIDCTASLNIYNMSGITNNNYNVNLKKGINCFEIPVLIEDDKCHYIVDLHAFNVNIVNKSLYKAIDAFKKPSVSVIANDDAVYSNITKMISKYSDVSRSTSLEDIAISDLLIVQDNILDFVTDEELENIKNIVRQGMGFLVLPSSDVFDDTVINNSVIKDILPVEIYKKNYEAMPVNAIVFVVDTSGSMDENCIQIAKEIVRNTVLKLTPQDVVGIVEFYGNRRWAAPIQSSANHSEINRAINRLTSEGDTFLLPAMKEAYYGLLNTSASSKHIVVISDGDIEKGDFSTLINDINEDNIVVSTVCVGNPLHASRMFMLSNLGKGVFYHSRDRFSIPVINFNSDSSSIAESKGLANSNILFDTPHSILDEVNHNDIVMRNNYYYSRAKPFAQSLLTDSAGYPVLTISRYGLGKVAFCSGDIFCESERASSILFQNLCRQLYKQSSENNIQIRQVGNILKIDFDFSFNRSGDLYPTIELLSNGSIKAVKDLRPAFIDGARLSTQFTNLDSDFYTLRIIDKKGNVVASKECNFNKINEYNQFNVNETLVDPDIFANETVSDNLKTAYVVELWPFFMILALVLFIFKILYRRIFIDMKGCIIIIVLSLFTIDNVVNGDENTEQPEASSATIISEVSSSVGNNPIVSFIKGNYSDVVDKAGQYTSATTREQYMFALANYQCENYSQATDIFYKLLSGEIDQHFAKMTFAWAMLSAEKAGEKTNLINKILETDGYINRYFELIVITLALENRYDVIRSLSDNISDELLEDGAYDEFLDQHLTSIYSLAGNDKNISEHQFGSDSIFISKLALLSGDRAKAAKILTGSVEKSSSPVYLYRVASFALEYSMYSAADLASKKIMKLDSQIFFEAAMVRIKVAIEQDRIADLLELLDSIISSNNMSFAQLSELAKIYDKISQPDLALALMENIYDKTENIDYLLLIAMHYEDINDFENAYYTWFKVWQLSIDNEYLHVGTKLLDIARISGKLPELAVELESLFENSNNVNTFYLLLSLYLGIEDSISLTDLIEQYYSNDTLNSLKIKHQAYFLCKEYDLCEKTLMQLQEEDKANKEIYIRKLGVLASLREDVNSLKWVYQNLSTDSTDVLTSVLQNATAAYSFGDYGTSVEMLESVIDDYPDDGELLLSWVNAMIACDKKSQALDRVVNIIRKKPNENLLTYVVDSLLNLDVGDKYLIDTLELIFEYIGRSPENILLYYQALDIAEELNKGDIAASIVLTALVYAPDQSFQLIRRYRRLPVIDNSFRQDFAKCLIYSNCQLTSDDYLSICIDFLEANEYSDAEYILKCYLSGTLDTNVYVQIADYYKKESLLDSYRSIVKEALLFMPDNYELLEMLASSYIVDGDFDKSFQLYYQIYNNIQSVYHYSTKISKIDLNIYRTASLDGMMVSSNNIHSDIIASLEIEIFSLINSGAISIEHSDLLITKIQDMVYVCIQSSEIAYARNLLKRLSQILKSKSVKLDSFLETTNQKLFFLPERIYKHPNDISSDSLRLSQHALDNSEIRDILVKVSLESSFDIRIDTVVSFLNNLYINKYVDQPTIKLFYYTIWGDLPLEKKRAFYDNLLSVDSYDENHYVTLLKIDAGVLDSYPFNDFYLKHRNDSDLVTSTAEIINVSDISLWPQITNKFLSCITDDHLVHVLTFISLLEKNVACELHSCIEDYINSISFNVSDSSLSVVDYVYYFEIAMQNKNILLSIIDKLINDNPELIDVYVLKLKYFPDLYANEIYYSNIYDLINIIVGNGEINQDNSSMLEMLLSLLPKEKILSISNMYSNVSVEGLNITAKHYVYSLICQYQDDYENAMKASYLAFIKEPGNAIFRKNLINNYEMSGEYEKLSMILADSLDPDLSINKILYRDIVGFICQSGDIDNALETVKAVHKRLRSIDMVSIYYLFSNAEMLPKCFRDCYSQHSLTKYAASWPGWQPVYGMTQWLQDNDSDLSFKNNHVYKISDNESLIDELKRFWFTVPANNELSKVYAQSFARVLVNTGKIEETIENLNYKYKNKVLSKKDFHLLLALFYHKPGMINKYPEMFSEIVSVSEANNKSDLLLISKIYFNNSNYSQAIKFAQQKIIYDVYSLRKNRFIPTINDNVNYLASLHEHCSDHIDVSVKILEGISLFLANDYDLTAYKLKLWSLAGNYSNADNLLEDIVQNRSVANFGSHKLAEESLKYCIKVENLSYFKIIYTEYIGHRMADISEDTLDYKYIFADTSIDHIQDYSDFIVNYISIKSDSNICMKSFALRHISMVAVAVYGKNTLMANEYLMKSSLLLCEPVINDLWLADAYYYCGDFDKAQKLERRLAEYGRLPYKRLMRLENGQ